MKTSPRRDPLPDTEALLTVLAMAVMASQPDFDSERFSALLLAAAMPDVGLDPATRDMLARIATSACDWAHAQRRVAEPDAHFAEHDVTLH